MASMRARLAKVFDNVKVKQVLIVNTDRADSNFLYLTGFNGGLFEGTMLLARRNSMTLFVSALEYGLAKRQKPKGMKIVLLNKSGMLKELLKKELKGKTVGINGSFVPYNTYKLLTSKIKAKLVDVSEGLSKARLVKDETEIKLMKRAVSVTKKALVAGRNSLKSGMTERDVAAVIDSTMLKLGSEPSFESIVAFDANTALPHHAPDDTKLKPNAIVLFDIGSRVDNYCSDMTRTFMFKPDKKSSKYTKFMDIYSVVATAQKLALSKIREGLKSGDSHSAAEKYINEYKGGIYKGKFIHALGHSIGIDVHDGGAGLYPGSKTRLKRNMVFSDEPGIYIEGFGGVRIEDDVQVGKATSLFM